MVVFTLEKRWEVGLRSTLPKNFGKKKNNLFRWSLFWSWRVCKQAKLSHLGYRKPTRVLWKANAPKTSYCFVRILVQRHNWTIFLRKWARKGRYSQWRPLSSHIKRSHYQPHSWCRLATSKLRFDTVGLLFVGGDKRYADKPETINALKDNICEAIGEIQLHTMCVKIGPIV